MINLIDIPILRTLAWRIGRRLYSVARRDVQNCPKSNGEYWLLEKLLQTKSNQDLVLMDIGANQGDWTAKARETLAHENRQGVIYAFEPTQSTYEFLSKRFEADESVNVNNLALSDCAGETEFFVVGALAGTNSLHREKGAVVEKVQTDKFDDFVGARKLENILFVKIDTEGHDLSVLRGAEKNLRAGNVEVFQFEYNHRWVSNHAFLKDVFDLIEDKPYSLGKLYGNGIEIYEKWHPELERFFEGNYVLVHKGSEIERLGVVMCFDVSNVLIPVID